MILVKGPAPQPMQNCLRPMTNKMMATMQIDMSRMGIRQVGMGGDEWRRETSCRRYRGRGVWDGVRLGRGLERNRGARGVSERVQRRWMIGWMLSRP